MVSTKVDEKAHFWYSHSFLIFFTRFSDKPVLLHNVSIDDSIIKDFEVKPALYNFSALTNPTPGRFLNS